MELYTPALLPCNLEELYNDDLNQSVYKIMETNVVCDIHKLARASTVFAGELMGMSAIRLLAFGEMRTLYTSGRFLELPGAVGLKAIFSKGYGEREGGGGRRWGRGQHSN